MDQKKRELLKQKAKHLAPKWMETGIKGERENFFGTLTKKQMSKLLYTILSLLIVADGAIFWLLYIQH